MITEDRTKAGETNMRVLVTGAEGQLGRDVVEVLQKRGHQAVAYGRPQLDITDMERCAAELAEVEPDAVIHCAAYTNVDGAEADPDAAYRVNAMGTRNMAVAAEQAGARFCYVSTDYVFDGRGQTPYVEYDPTDPQSIYGKSKRAGELLVQSLSTRYYIVRTSWVYGRHGRNFVKTMLQLGAAGKPLQVIDDQVGSPTYSVDLAQFLVELVGTQKYGIYHASNTGACSWYEFASAIFEESGMAVELRPCTTEQFPRPAPRPAYSVMDSMAIRTNGLAELRGWREALKEFLLEWKKELWAEQG